MTEWEWKQTYRMLKGAFTGILVEIAPGCLLICLLVLLIVFLQSRLIPQNVGGNSKGRTFHLTYRHLPIVLYGYILLYTTIFRRSVGIYKPLISTDLYFLRLGWYEIYEGVLNVLLFVPMGIILNITGDLNARRAVVIALSTSILIETLQLISGCGTFEVADIILNTAGAAIGFLLTVLVCQVIYKAKGIRL